MRPILIQDPSSIQSATQHGGLERLMRLLLCCVFLFAALLKSFHPDVTQLALITILQRSTPLSLESVRIISQWGTVFVISWELALGLMLILSGARRTTALASAATLMLFSAALVRLLTIRGAPSCGCLGLPLGLSDARSEAWLGLIRNAGLIWIALWLYSRPNADRPGPHPRHQAEVSNESSQAPETTNSRAFTLIELLVTLGIVVILLGILLPALAGAKKSGRVAQTLATERQMLTMIDLYADSYTGMFPYLGTPHEPDKGLQDITVNGGYPTSYFDQYRAWPTALARDGYDIESIADAPENRFQFDIADNIVVTSYFMTHAVAAGPEYWVNDLPPDDIQLFDAVRKHQVRFPSKKGLLVHLNPLPSSRANSPTHPDFYNQSWSVAFCDGSASVQQRDPIQAEINRPHGAIPWTVLITTKGVHGQDY